MPVTCILIDDVLNLSDHDPVLVTLKGNLPTSVSLIQDIELLDGAVEDASNKTSIKRLRWDHADLVMYTNLTYINLAGRLTDINLRFEEMIVNSDCGNPLCPKDCTQCLHIAHNVTN